MSPAPLRRSFTARASLLAAILALLVPFVPALARTAEAQAEDLEPRRVGGRGATFVGVAGYVDRFSSSEDDLPLTYTAQVDVCRFLTDRFAIRLGAVGTGSVGGEQQNDRLTGSGAPAVHAAGGLLYYFTPRSMVSLYVGAEYWAQLTERKPPDSGSVLGTAGLQAALSSRASLFVQGGFGTRITRGDGDELITRIVAQMGLRIKL
jgi:hypothetical protein